MNARFFYRSDCAKFMTSEMVGIQISFSISNSPPLFPIVHLLCVQYTVSHWNIEILVMPAYQGFIKWLEI